MAVSEDAQRRVQAFLDVITDGVTAKAGDIKGLSPQLLQEVEDDQAAPLGDIYRWFLALAGGGAGRFLQGSDVFHPHVLGLWPAAQGLLEENQSEFVLQDTDRVIFMHQGCQFDFLRGGEPDPEVWSYCEVSSPGNAPKLSHDHFSDWLMDNAQEQTRAWIQLANLTGH